MTKNNKKLSVSLLGVALAVTFTGGFAVLSANADELIPTATEFYMTPGASARLDGTGEYSGMRFEATVSETWYNEIKTTYNTAQNITFGMLIAPTRNLTNGLSDLTVENVDTLKATNIVKGDATFEAGSMKFQGSITYSKTELEADYEEWKKTDITEEQAKALLEQTYDLELVGRAYCSFTVGETPYTYYAVPDDNERTVREVMNAHDIAKPTDLSESEKAQFLDDITTATAYADLEGDVVFDKDTANKLYVGASGQDKTLDNGYVQWTGLVDDKTVGDTITVSTIEKGKITRINVSVIDEVMTDAGDLTALNNTSEEVNNKKYALGKSLDASAVTMAHDNGTGVGFGGLFDGMGHTISNLNIGSGAGLFGELAVDAVVQNLALYDITVNKGFYFADNAVNYTLGNVYVKLSEQSKNPRGFSKMTRNGQMFENVIVEYTGENAVKVPTSDNYSVYDAWGVLFGSIYFNEKGTSTGLEGAYGADANLQNVYVISPSLLIYGSWESYYVYGANETTDIWGRAIRDGQYGIKHSFGENEKYHSGITRDYYCNIPMQKTYHYDNYSGMNENDLNAFKGNPYWVVSNGVVYWEDAYENSVKAVVTDATGAEVDNYQITPNNTSLTLSLYDTAKIEGVTYTVSGADENLVCSANGVITLAGAHNSGTDATYTVTATVGNVSKSIQVIVTSKAVYNEKVTLSTMDNTYDFGTTGFTLQDQTFTKAYINDVEIELVEGALPTISMKYYKDFTSQSWGNAKGRVTYMDILVGDTVIVDNKEEQTPVSLTLESANGTYVFNNLMVYTKVLKTAKDLEIFNHLGLNYGGIAKTGYYVLGNNIDATTTDIYHDYDESLAFTGTFDGQGYTISNLDVSKTAVESKANGTTGTYKQGGLFGVISAGLIKNVGFVNVNAQDGAVLGKIVFRDSNFQDQTLLQGTHRYFGSAFENIYIQIADTVTQTQGMLSTVADKMHLTKDIVIEYNPTEPATQTNGYGSFIGSLAYDKFQQVEWTKSNLYVMSSVAIGYVNDAPVVANPSHLTYRTNRQALINDHSAYTLDTTYWTTTSGAPVWNTANWQSAN